jgi:hypothetical protein
MGMYAREIIRTRVPAMAADTAPTRPEHRGLPKLRLLLGLGGLLCIVALLTLPSFAPWLSRAEYWTADWRTAYLSYRAPTQNPRIAIVAINDSTLKDYSSSPIDRGLLAKVITAIDTAGAKAIGIDVFFLKKTEPAKDAALASSSVPSTSAARWSRSNANSRLRFSLRPGGRSAISICVTKATTWCAIPRARHRIRSIRRVSRG